MTSVRQIESNRRNALKSTGPRTEAGKRRSRRNAFRHGLTAETVVELLEDVDDYKAFQRTIAADYDPYTAVERELVLRLASLLWRIRRATGIETDLLRMAAEKLSQRDDPPHTNETSCEDADSFPRVVLLPAPNKYKGNSDTENTRRSGCRDTGAHSDSIDSSINVTRPLTACFLRVADSDNAEFERIGRYEGALWKQFLQTLFALDPLRTRKQRLRFFH